jgi:hypothetical protein
VSPNWIYIHPYSGVPLAGHVVEDIYPHFLLSTKLGLPDNFCALTLVWKVSRRDMIDISGLDNGVICLGLTNSEPSTPSPPNVDLLRRTAWPKLLVSVVAKSLSLDCCMKFARRSYSPFMTGGGSTVARGKTSRSASLGCEHPSSE